MTLRTSGTFEISAGERIRALLAEHHGFEVKTIGDSFMAAFDNASDAVLCAVSIQRSLRHDPIPTNRGALAIRIGMHTWRCYTAGAHVLRQRATCGQE